MCLLDGVEWFCDGCIANIINEALLFCVNFYLFCFVMVGNFFN